MLRLWTGPHPRVCGVSQKIQDSKIPKFSNCRLMQLRQNLRSIRQYPPQRERHRVWTKIWLHQRPDLFARVDPIQYADNLRYQPSDQAWIFNFLVQRSISCFIKKIPSKGYIPLDPLRVPAPNKYNNMKVETGSKYSMRMKTKTLDRSMSI